MGGRIIAETFHRAMEGSRFSIVRSPGSAQLGGVGRRFRMVDLLLFAFKGQEAAARAAWATERGPRVDGGALRGAQFITW